MTGQRYRLLTEAEYEYAARAGTETAYPWGDDVGKNNANCNACGSQWDNNRDAPVGSFAPNQFGLYDMVGNVWEWTQDCYHPDYNGAPTDGSEWTADCPDDHIRVQRGGGKNAPQRVIRSAIRSSVPFDTRRASLGFRVVRMLNP
jgi:formylglycine-generating enzyme required for sulfatase activity